jgi:hypothetical protein
MTLPDNPEDVEDGTAAVKKPFDLKFLWRRQSSAEAFDSQYGNVMFSSPT